MNFLQDLSIDKVRNLAEDAFNQAKPKTEVETRVYEVLSHKNWGASTSLLNQVAKDSYDYDKYAVVSELMWQSMENQRPAAWRVVFKALSLLEHLIKNGSERCVDDARNHGHSLRALQQFNYYEGTIDRGLGVREKSKQLIEILSDDERVREERQKAKKLREKFGSKLGGVSGGAGASSGGYGGSSGWDSGTSSGYGEGGIGSERKNGGGNRFDADPRGPSGAYTGRYDEDRGARASTAAEPTFAALPDEKRTKNKSKKVAEPARVAAPEIDLFAFDEAAAPAQAPAASVPADDFSDFQGSSASGIDPFAAPAPVPVQQNGFENFSTQQSSSAAQFDAFSQPSQQSNSQQQQFDAFGTSATSGGMQNNFNTMGGGGIGQSSMGMQSTAAVTQQVHSNFGGDEDDDFGDFSAAQTSKPPSAAAKSNDPFGSLISLDGLSLNSNKKKTEDKLNAPVIANAAAATYIQEKEHIEQAVQQSKKGNMASFDGLVDLPKQNNMGGLSMNFGMNMNSASFGMNPSVMGSGGGGDAIGSIFDPSNLQPQQSHQQMGGMPQGFGGQQANGGNMMAGNPMMGQMNQQQQMMMAQMTPQQQQQMMQMMQQRMLQQQQQSGFGGQGMGNSMGGGF
ncbi:hypothetical protein MPSEU_000087200 [Mayamaea pseudoterrestris]|nr:hypothetical protein MPSEU_000087200 [Mayamaea pseudoterrestris]